MSYEQLISQLSIEEKVELLTGETAFTLHGNEGIGLAPLAFSDGPNGVRGLKFIGGESVALLPAATLIAASWDPEQARLAGQILGEEAHRQEIDVVLAPTVNLHRSPLGGRLFEAFSEDPYLTGALARETVAGLQNQGIAATTKHLVANESESLRNFMDSRVDEAVLREVYLLPFEMTSNTWATMSGYNNVNGVPASQNKHTQQEILKDEWGWDGLIMSDWYATKTTVDSVTSGLDLVMPGPGGPWEQRLVDAVKNGEVAESVLDDHVERLLRLAERVGKLRKNDAAAPSRPVTLAPDAPERAKQLEELAARGIVVAKNEGAVLPLAKDATIAVFGRLATESTVMGGGSATVNPPYIVNYDEGLRSEFGDGVSVHDGVDYPGRALAALPGVLTNPVTGDPGAQWTLLDADGRELTAFAGGSQESLEDLAVEHPALTRVRIEAKLAVETAGQARVGAVGIGRWTITVGDKTLTKDQQPYGFDPGESIILTPGFAEDLPAHQGDLITAEAELVEIDWAERIASQGIETPQESHIREISSLGRFGIAAKSTPTPDDTVLAAVPAQAEAADIAVVVVGLTALDETESKDKESLALPGRQDDLVRAVAGAAKKTVVVVNSATPVLMPWIDEVDAVVLAGIGGQEAGNALAAALSGRIEPSGRVATSWPVADGARTGWNVTPGDGWAVEYSEGRYIGYRGHDAGKAEAPLFWLGHGLGYGSWEYAKAEATADGGTLAVSVDVTNSSARPSRETVQLYVRVAEDDQPIRLSGFHTELFQPGETKRITVSADPLTLRGWSSDGWTPLTPTTAVLARGLGDVRAEVQL
jgi:beta-glucosidase